MDIGEELYDEIRKEIERQISKNTQIQKILKRIESGTATHADTEKYALLLGEITSKALQMISSENLPDGELYYNIAEKTVGQTLVDNLARVNAVGEPIQKSLNAKIGIGLGAVGATLNHDRVHDLVSNIADCLELTHAKELMGEPVINTTQSFADALISANAEAQDNAGLTPVIVRTADPDCCPWCAGLEGTYDYNGIDRDVFRRHENCRCTIELTTMDKRTTQRRWTPNQEQVKERKAYGL